ncbi:nuclear transport factor 2 family protein [Mucilaginibacter lutimaris]|uniref:Nuclear transport factor 2 family protein n=1 Tax=Mucilaginibacter lutimaris TaxID=931629 RepID=A0ABW2ZEC5_9SPHI
MLNMKTNKSILLKANEYIVKNDHEGFLSLCTEDLVWEFVGDQILNGKQAVREYMKSVYNESPDFDVEELIGDGDQVVAVGRITLKDESGKYVTSEYCDVWKFREGKMAALKAFVSEVRS